MGRLELVFAAGLASAMAVPALAQTPAPIAVDPSLAPYASTANSVRLPDGRTLHLVCMGEGSPAVIFNSGGTAWSAMWNAVQPEVAKKTRACAWDR